MSSIRFRYVGLGIALVGACATAMVACSSSDASSAPGGGTGGYPFGGAFGAGGAVPGGGGAIVGGGGATALGNGGAVPGGGGATSGGGTTAAGGGVAVGGSTSASDIKIVGSVTQCPGTTAQLPSTSVSACTMAGCTAAHCIPAANMPPGEDTSLLSKCPDGSFCTPDDYIATYGKFQAKTCTSLLGAEGRCISTCIPQVNTQLKTLPKDVCADTELCAPCYNPIDGTDTHACTQGCDHIVDTTPKVFTGCGAATDPKPGVCVPGALVTDPTQLAALQGLNTVNPPAPGIPCAEKDASGANYLCAPVAKAKDQSYQFPACTPTSFGGGTGMANAAGQKGGCVPAYIAGSNAGLLLIDGCQTGELCAPCTNLLNGNAPTGACPWP